MEEEKDYGCASDGAHVKKLEDESKNPPVETKLVEPTEENDALKEIEEYNKLNK